jgi:hypothetical protein
MTPEQAANHPSKNIISRALGAEPDVDIDLKTIMVEPGTTFLLCSDGITRHIDDAEMGGILANGNPSSICDRLKEICYARGAEDNLTAIVVRVSGEPVREFSAAAGAGDSTADVEEQTVASARSPFDSTVEMAEEVEELPANEPVALDELDDQSYLMEEEPILEDEPRPDLQDYASSSVIVPAQQTQFTPPPPAPPVRPYVRPVVVEEKAPSALPRLLNALLFLVLGALLGAGAYYYWLQTQPEPVVETPVITEMKSSNTTLTAFEDARRLVDKDPAAYINANAASLQTPEDYFLMGRAFMLTGKYWEAKRSFNDARNRLASADKLNAKTMAAEISMALAVIESPQATESFTKDIATASSTTPANSNTAPTNQPLR